MIEETIEELTKLLIKQDLKDKKDGVEYIKIPKIQVIKENVKLLKFINNFK